MSQLVKSSGQLLSREASGFLQTADVAMASVAFSSGPILLQKSIFADDQNSAGRGRDFRVQDAGDLTAS
ncbi:hypothetical protein, partial [Bradyrhizobium japonicum]|uniref:hypothetical protein n=2 Tax=Bradyrhizobium TaxID=374 RepID=UPI001AECA6D1